MCGIAGYIGHSKKPNASFELITKLFDNLETRGTDAAGVWATETAEKGRVVYHKMPIKSSEFVQTAFWKKLKKLKLDMMLVHARAASKGTFHAKMNKNNHPFVSLDRRIGMVHNGTIEEASEISQKFETLSDTDSECLLRLYEHGLEEDYFEIDGVPNDIAGKVNGISNIWSVIHRGAMAVALGERITADRRGLFLFRNDKRPLWLCDMRAKLGQVFFFSTPDIWYRAITEDDDLKNLCWDGQKIMELPVGQIWYLGIDNKNPVLSEKNLFKMNVHVKSTGKEWDEDQQIEIQSAKEKLTVITDLNEDDEIECKSEPISRNTKRHTFYPSHSSVLPISDDSVIQSSKSIKHQELCEKIQEITENINTLTSNLLIEGSLRPTKYQELLDSLNSVEMDLFGTLTVLESP